MRRIYEDDEVVVTSGRSVASDIIWAIVTLAVVGILVWAIFFSGFFSSHSTKKIDINVDTPVSNVR